MTVEDFDQAVALYRDALGLTQLEDWSSDRGRVILLEAGRATLELLDEAQAAFVDEIEVGQRVSGAVRIAFEVVHSVETARRLVEAGAREVAPPILTPWGDRNARVETPDGMQFVLVPHGPEGLPYWISTAHGTQTWTNLDSGATLSKAFNIIDRDLEVTDNGDGTLTVVTLATGGERWYGPDGKLLFRNPGQVRLEYLVDTDGEWHFVGVVKESTGRNDTEGRDFCEDMATYLGN